MKLKERLRAIELRKKGKSYGEILKKIRVSKGTLSVWLRDVQLTSAQRERIYKTLRQESAYRGAKIQQRKRVERTKQIITEARKEASFLVENPLFLAGLMLYWAEGDKSERGYAVKFSNSDPSMIKFVMKWFREICMVPEEKFRIALHAHKFHCRNHIENYWSEITNIPLAQFYKTVIKPTSLRHRKNPLYNGTCAIRINNVNLLRKIKGWNLGFLEKENIEIKGRNKPL